MKKQDLTFFCNACRSKRDNGIEQADCTIPHTVRRFKKGEHIAYHGNRVQHLTILVEGRIKTEIVSDSGLSLPMEEIDAPYPLAAAFLFADDNRFPVDVVAVTDCEVIFIPKESVEKQMAVCPEFMRGFMAFNANRMQYLSERLKIFAQKGIKNKIGYYILAREKDGEFDLGRSVASLADYFGVERPSLSRAISEMVRSGLITFQHGKGKILDLNALEELFV